MRGLWKYLSGAAVNQRYAPIIAVCSVVLIAVLTLVGQLQIHSRPMQVRELAGRNVSMDKLADVFIAIDQITIARHFASMFIVNVTVFLSALLLIVAIGSSSQKK